MHASHSTPWVEVEITSSTWVEVEVTSFTSHAGNSSAEARNSLPSSRKPLCEEARNSLPNNGRGRTWDGRTGSTSVCSRTGNTFRMQQFRVRILRQSLQDPAQPIREGNMSI